VHRISLSFYGDMSKLSWNALHHVKRFLCRVLECTDQVIVIMVILALLSYPSLCTKKIETNIKSKQTFPIITEVLTYAVVERLLQCPVDLG